MKASDVAPGGTAGGEGAPASTAGDVETPRPPGVIGYYSPPAESGYASHADAHSAPPPRYAAPLYAAPPAAGAAGAAASRPARPKGVAIAALVLAAAGLVVGSLRGGAPLTGLLLLAGFVLAIVALASRGQGGKGFAAGALATAVLGGFVVFGILLAHVLGVASASPDVEPHPPSIEHRPGTGVAPEGAWGVRGDDVGDRPGIAAPGEDGRPDPGYQVAAPPVAPTVTGTGFGRGSGGVWWYAVVLDNPNTDFVFETRVGVVAHGADGSVVTSASAFPTLLAGQTIVTGSLVSPDADIVGIAVDVPEASQATLSPGDETGAFTTEQVAAASDAGATAVTGAVRGRFAEDQRFVTVSVIARAADGGIVAAASTYLDRVPGDDSPIPFEAWFLDALPADAVLQTSAHR